MNSPSETGASVVWLCAVSHRDLSALRIGFRARYQSQPRPPPRRWPCGFVTPRNQPTRGTEPGRPQLGRDQQGRRCTSCQANWSTRTLARLKWCRARSFGRGSLLGGLRNTVLRRRPTNFYPAVSVSTALLDFPFSSHTSRRKLLRWANMSDRPDEFLNVLGASLAIVASVPSSHSMNSGSIAGFGDGTERGSTMTENDC